jgi:serine/threonine protein kinase
LRFLIPALYSRRDGVWKLTDFGFSKHVSSRSLGLTSNAYGTNGYYAPEFLLPGSAALSYDCTADIWSLGCILYELAIGQRLFEHDYYAWRYKETGILPAIEFNDDSFSDEEKVTIQSYVKRMLCLEPKERPAATDLITEFSLNYSQATATHPQHIQIYEDFRAIRQEVRSTPDGFSTTTQIAAFTTMQTEFVPVNQMLPPSEPGSDQLVSGKLSTFSRISNLNVEEKMAFILKLTEEDATNYWIWHALSTLYANSDDLAGAIEAFEREFEKSPQNPAICMELINLYAANCNYDKGADYGDRLLRMTPTVIRNAVVRPEDPEVVEIIHNFKAKEMSLKLQVTAPLLSDFF